MPQQWWRPDRFLKKRNNLLARAKLFAAMRSYFADEGFIEVDTPLLHASPAMEPHLVPFITTFASPHGGGQDMFLVTSPEINCKKLLVAGMEKIYQLSHVFRNAEHSSRHHPEFTLLEWYRVGAEYDALMQDCENLLRVTSKVCANVVFSYQGKTCDVSQSAERITVAEAFKRYADMDVFAVMEDRNKLCAQAAHISVRCAGDDTIDDILLRIIGEKIEPHLGVGRPCFLTDYPISLAALARAKPSDQRVAERFELYVCGVELANAFVELTDAQQQRARFEADMKVRQERYGKTYFLDEDFLNALQHGMPQAAGIALGIDRLLMLMLCVENIEDVMWAPVV